MEAGGSSPLGNLSSSPKYNLLLDDMCSLLQASLAKATWGKYSSGWAALEQFTKFIGIKPTWPLSMDYLRGFTIFCIRKKNLQPSTTRSYLSAVVALHRIKGFANFSIKDDLVAAALKGAGNIIMSSISPPANPRRVMTLQLLKHMGHRLSISSWSQGTTQSVWSACTTAFFTSARMGELLTESENDFDPTSTLTWSSVKFRQDGSILIHLKQPKSGNKEGDFLDIFPFKGHNCCPVKAIQKQLEIQRKIGAGLPSSPVFSLPNGKFLSTKGLNKILKVVFSDICDRNNTIACHSFRAGVPSILAKYPEAATTDDIKGWGRWNSDCYQHYTRLKLDQKRKIFNKITLALLQ